MDYYIINNLIYSDDVEVYRGLSNQQQGVQMTPVIEELAREVPGLQVNSAAAVILDGQNPRSRNNIFSALRLLNEKFPRKRVNVQGCSFSSIDPEKALDKNTIQINILAAPLIKGVCFYTSGVVSDNFIDNEKVVHGKSVLMINGGWLTLTQKQRAILVEGKNLSEPARVVASEHVLNRIFSENSVEIGFAIHNQIFLFMDLFDSKSNAGEIFKFIVEKAIPKMSFDFAASLKPEQIAEHIYVLKTAGYKAELAKKESEIKNNQLEQNKMLSAYSSAVRTYETLVQQCIALRGYQEDKGKSISRIAQEVQSLITQKKYMEFHIERDVNGVPMLCAATNRIFIVHKDTAYDFGYYTVKIGLGNMLSIDRVGFDHAEINEAGYVHPHASSMGNRSDRTVCWGSMQAEIAKLCGQGDIMRILDACYYFLQSYNEANPYKHIHLFRGAKHQPMSDFKNRPEPTEEEYREFAQTVRAVEPVVRVTSEVAIDVDNLVCEGCGESEESCFCDTEHPLIPRSMRG